MTAKGLKIREGKQKSVYANKISYIFLTKRSTLGPQHVMFCLSSRVSYSPSCHHIINMTLAGVGREGIYFARK